MTRAIRGGLAVAAVISAVVLLELVQLPDTAARQGSGSGAAWPTATIASVIACVTVPLLFLVAWRLTSVAPRLAASGPAAIAIVATLARWLAARGAPEEFYLVDDRRLWILYFGVSAIISVALQTYASIATRAANARSAKGTS
jgi:hypothetical protein